MDISRGRSIVHREYGGGFRICVPGPKVKFHPLGFITPCYSSRRISSCLFHNDKGTKSLLFEEWWRGSISADGPPAILARLNMAPDWTKLPGDGVVFLGISLLFTFLGVFAISARSYTSWACAKRFRLDYWLSLFTFVRNSAPPPRDGRELELKPYRFFYASAKRFLSSVLFLVSELMPRGFALKTSS